MRKFLSVLLAMAMVLSLSVTSFAADTDSEAKAEMAGKTVIAEPESIVPVGVIPPDAVKTPGVLVDHLLIRAN